jgi:threonine synthase
MATIAFFECSRCRRQLDAAQPATVCPADAGPLYVRYDLAALKGKFTPQSLIGRLPSMWRYAEVLPPAAPVTLGEGFTPLLPSRKLPNVFIKDEGLNPTGSFKARGLCAAVTMAKAYGLRKLAVPSAGNAAGALAAYCAAAGLEAHIFMPRDAPQANQLECRTYGAHLTLVNGLISDCARLLAQRKQAEGWFDVSSLQEPFRLEGKKTMGYEVAEQLGWRLPQAIIYPTGGGVGLIGMWKAFDEMQELGWMGQERPRMIVVQASGCAPLVKAWEEGKPASEAWPEAVTIAAGLRVPKAYADSIVLDIVRKSGGTAIAVSDAEILDAVREWGRDEGVFAAPEGAASLACYKKLLQQRFLRPSDCTVLFNTASGLKYVDVLSRAGGGRTQPASRQMGGIISPY